MQDVRIAPNFSDLDFYDWLRRIRVQNGGPFSVNSISLLTPSALLLCFTSLSALGAEPGASIGSIDGAKKVRVTRALDSSTQSVGSGARLQAGDSLKTEPKQTVSLRFADGSVMIVGTQTELILLNEEKAENAIRLLQGTVRTLVPPKKLAHTPAGKPTIRFMIRRHAVVMGVRGTDFIAQASGDTAGDQGEVIVLQGTVAAAKGDTEKGEPDPVTLIAEGNGTEIHAGQKLESKEDGTLSEPMTIDTEKELQELAKAQPEMSFAPKTETTPEPTPATTPPDAGTQTRELSTFQWVRLQLGASIFSYSDRHSSLGAHVAWIPKFRILRDYLYATGYLGLFYFLPAIPSIDDVLAGSGLSFGGPGMEASGTLGVGVSFIFAEAGGGAQVWYTGGGFHAAPVLRAKAGFRFNPRWISVIDHIAATGAFVFASMPIAAKSPTWELGGTIGFAIGAP